MQAKKKKRIRQVKEAGRRKSMSRLNVSMSVTRIVQRVLSVGTGNCKNTVSFIPGTDLIEVKGFVNVSAEFYWWNYHLLSANEEQTDR